MRRVSSLKVRNSCPAGRPPVELGFRDAGDKPVAFEKPGHGYPQRITYRVISAGRERR
jgi:hypothetical protein